jgi:hypothetical protein
MHVSRDQNAHVITEKNVIREENKMRITAGYQCHCGLQDLMSKIEGITLKTLKIYKTILKSVVYGCEIWPMIEKKMKLC